MQAREWATGYEPPLSRGPAKAAAAHGPARAVFRSGFSILPSFPERSYHFATGRNDSQTFMSAHPRRSEPLMPRTCLAVALVTGPDQVPLAEAAKQLAPAAGIFLQRERRGTAHAVLAAREAIVCGYDDLL